MSPQETICALRRRIQDDETRLLISQRICASCTMAAPNDAIECESIDCSWFFQRKKAEDNAELLPLLEECVQEIEIYEEEE
jgi:DNA polymerase zeta